VLRFAYTQDDYNFHRAVRMSQMVITMLPSSLQVLTVYSEGAGIIPALHSLRSDSDARGTLCIDSTTLDIRAAHQVAQEVAHTGAVMIDAPVSGGAHSLRPSDTGFSFMWHLRCFWRKSRDALIPRWGDERRLQLGTAVSPTNGTADYPLQPVWLRIGREDM